MTIINITNTFPELIREIQNSHIDFYLDGKRHYCQDSKDDFDSWQLAVNNSKALQDFVAKHDFTEKDLNCMLFSKTYTKLIYTVDKEKWTSVMINIINEGINYPEIQHLMSKLYDRHHHENMLRIYQKEINI